MNIFLIINGFLVGMTIVVLAKKTKYQIKWTKTLNEETLIPAETIPIDFGLPVKEGDFVDKNTFLNDPKNVPGNPEYVDPVSTDPQLLKDVGNWFSDYRNGKY